LTLYESIESITSSAYDSTARQIEPANFMLDLPFCVYMLMYCC